MEGRLHPGHRRDGDRLGAAGLPWPGRAAPPGGAVAGLVGDQVVAGRHDTTAGFTLVDHPALTGLSASPGRVWLQYGSHDFFRNYF